MKNIILQPVGITHTPYTEKAPFRPDENADGDFFIDLHPEYSEGLYKLDAFSHIIVIFYFDRINEVHLTAHPPRLNGEEVGLFASRSPYRPNKIGLNVLRLLKIEGSRIFTSPMDVLDATPVLDIKPYIPDTDLKIHASRGWLPEGP